MDECLGFNCYIPFLIDHITNGCEEWCDCKLKMMWHGYMCSEFN
jgi:hypothetical protein